MKIDHDLSHLMLCFGHFVQILERDYSQQSQNHHQLSHLFLIPERLKHPLHLIIQWIEACISVLAIMLLYERRLQNVCVSNDLVVAA